MEKQFVPKYNKTQDGVQEGIKLYYIKKGFHYFYIFLITFLFTIYSESISTILVINKAFIIQLEIAVNLTSITPSWENYYYYVQFVSCLK